MADPVTPPEDPSARLLAGRSGLITGAANGIGRACAWRLAAEGANVVLGDVAAAAEAGEQAVAEIRAAGGSAAFVVCDVTQAEDHDRLVAAVLDRHGRLDFALNNAGIGVHARLHETDDADYDRVIAVNLRGVFLGLKRQITAMLANPGPDRGAIVNTSSNAGLAGIVGLSAYVASKHGVIGLTRNAATEYAEDGIRVNAVCPGATRTALMDGIDAARQLEIMAPQPMLRAADPAEIAACVAWLCSSEASFVTGAALPVDGGSVAWLSAHPH